MKAGLYVSAVKVGIYKSLLLLASGNCVKHVHTIMTLKPK